MLDVPSIPLEAGSSILVTLALVDVCVLRVLISLWGCVLVHCKVVNCSCRGLLWWCVNQLCWNRTTFGLPRSWKYPFGSSLRWPKTDVDVDVENFHSFSLCLWRKTKKNTVCHVGGDICHMSFSCSRPYKKLIWPGFEPWCGLFWGNLGFWQKKLKKKRDCST